MADQGRWFKLWCDSLDDSDLDNLPISEFGRWAKFGAHVKRHGDGGTIQLSSPSRTLVAQLQVDDFQALISAIQLWPNMTICCDGDPVTNATVTFNNWEKYQGDRSIERTRRWRDRVTAKKRREEKRGSKDPKIISAPDPGAPVSPKKKPVPKPEVKTVIDAYHVAFKERFGSAPVIAGGKCGNIAKQLLAGRSLDETLWILREYFREPPEFFRAKGCWGMEHVLSAATSILARKGTAAKPYLAQSEGED